MCVCVCVCVCVWVWVWVCVYMCACVCACMCVGVYSTLHSVITTPTFPSPAIWKPASVMKISSLRDTVLHPINCRAGERLCNIESIVIINSRLYKR